MSGNTSPYVFTEARRQKWLREGRGAGSGVEYRPWLETRNVKSSGRKHRLPGVVHDRVMHLMSDLERNAVLHFELQPQVTDIREQFPLDRDVTRSIARAMGVRHPTDTHTGVEIVMTTDLVVSFTSRTGATISRAFSVKQSEDLLSQRTRDKQEIERRYWERMGLRWQLLLDNQLRNDDYFAAILWARAWFRIPVNGAASLRIWQVRCQRVLAELAALSGGDLRDLVRRAERAGCFSAGEVLSTLRHLVARQVVGYDFTAGVPTLDTPVALFAIQANGLRLVA